MKTRSFPSFVVLAGAAALTACGERASETEVSFSTEVKPLLEEHCGNCHAPGGAGAEKSGLVLEGHDSLMKGTRYGPIVEPGSAISSTLYLVVAGKTDPSIQMPHGEASLSEGQVTLIRQWIDQGAPNN